MTEVLAILIHCWILFWPWVLVLLNFTRFNKKPSKQEEKKEPKPVVICWSKPDFSQKTANMRKVLKDKRCGLISVQKYSHIWDKNPDYSWEIISENPEGYISGRKDADPFDDDSEVARLIGLTIGSDKTEVVVVTPIEWKRTLYVSSRRYFYYVVETKEKENDDL